MRRLVTLLLVPVVLAIAGICATMVQPTEAQAKVPNVIVVTSPGHWPVCAVVKGGKVVKLTVKGRRYTLGIQHNKTLVCFGKKGHFQVELHMHSPPRSISGTVVSGSKDWLHGLIKRPGHPSELWTMSVMTWYITIHGHVHYVHARVKLFIIPGRPGHPKPWAFYGNGHPLRVHLF
jgi:hypothetical protein